MNRLTRIRHDAMLALRARRAERRLRAATITDLVGTLTTLQQRVDDLENDLDSLRADSRRVAELRVQVEDFLADRTSR